MSCETINSNTFFVVPLTRCVPNSFFIHTRILWNMLHDSFCVFSRLLLNSRRSVRAWSLRPPARTARCCFFELLLGIIWNSRATLHTRIVHTADKYESRICKSKKSSKMLNFGQETHNSAHGPATLDELSTKRLSIAGPHNALWLIWETSHHNAQYMLTMLRRAGPEKARQLSPFSTAESRVHIDIIAIHNQRTEFIFHSCDLRQNLWKSFRAWLCEWEMKLTGNIDRCLECFLITIVNYSVLQRSTKHTEQREIQLDLIFFLLCRRCRRRPSRKKHCAAFLFRFSSVRKKSKVSSEFQLLFSIFLCLLLSLSCQIYDRMPLRITQ